MLTSQQQIVPLIVVKNDATRSITTSTTVLACSLQDDTKQFVVKECQPRSCHFKCQISCSIQPNSSGGRVHKKSKNFGKKNQEEVDYSFDASSILEPSRSSGKDGNARTQFREKDFKRRISIIEEEDPRMLATDAGCEAKKKAR